MVSVLWKLLTELLLEYYSCSNEAFSDFCDKLFPLLVAYFQQFPVLREDAEDLAQEVLVKIMNSKWRSPYDPDNKAGASLWTWVDKIRRNTAIDQLRKRGRIPPQEYLDAPLGGEEDGQTLHDLLAAAGLSAEGQAIIRDCLDRLEDREREILRLKDYEEMTLEEISEALGIAISTVHGYLHRARKKMRECLGTSDVLRGSHGIRPKPGVAGGQES